jgi:hypothetical protein
MIREYGVVQRIGGVGVLQVSSEESEDRVVAARSASVGLFVDAQRVIGIV